MIHLNQELMNLLLRYLLERFVEILKTKEVAILLGVEAVNRTNCPGPEEHIQTVF